MSRIRVRVSVSDTRTTHGGSPRDFIFDFIMRCIYNFRMLQMNSNLLKSFGFLALTMALANCTSGGGGPAKNTLCNINIPSISMDKGPAQSKIDVKPDADLTLPAGVYKYNGAQFYYVDLSDRNKPILLHLAHKPGTKADENGFEKLEVLCSAGRGIDRDMTRTEKKEIEVISSMTIDQNGKTTITKKKLWFILDPAVPGTIISDGSGTSAEVQGSLKELYQGKGNVEQAVYTFPGNIVETRAKIEELTPDKSKKSGVELRSTVSFVYMTPEEAAKAAEEAAKAAKEAKGFSPQE